MNMVLHGLAANAQHRTDDALGVWKARGKGSQRIHENYDGWQLRTNTRRTWTIHRPDGVQVGTPGMREWSALWVAKAEAERAIAEEAARG
jgi:hypothetical protein